MRPHEQTEAGTLTDFPCLGACTPASATRVEQQLLRRCDEVCRRSARARRFEPLKVRTLKSLKVWSLKTTNIRVFSNFELEVVNFPTFEVRNLSTFALESLRTLKHSASKDVARDAILQTRPAASFEGLAGQNHRNSTMVTLCSPRATKRKRSCPFAGFP